MRDETIAKRPMPKRPLNGLLAWQATIGYISTQHSPDATLHMHAYPADKGILWAAAASWGQNQEQVTDLSTLAAALRELWRVVDQHHIIFHTELDSIRRPADYADDDWLDTKTSDILDRLVRVTHSVFKHDWSLNIVYQAVDNPSVRVQARLLARSNSVQVGGRGGSVHDACSDLYRNAARVYAGAIGDKPED